MKSIYNGYVIKIKQRKIMLLQNSLKLRLEIFTNHINELKNVIRLRENYYKVIKKCSVMKIE